MLGETHANALKSDFNYFFKLIHPRDLEVFRMDMEESISLKVGWDRKGSFFVDEKVIYFHSRSILTEKKDGTLLITILIIDETKERQLEEKNSALAIELIQLIDTANAPIFGIDRDGKVNEWNQKAVQITGLGKCDVIGKHLVDEFISCMYKQSVQ